MTLSYNLAPIPKWVILNNEGTAAGGAKLYTYRSLNKIEQKPVYQDPNGDIYWTNPIIFDLNGVQGPFYWEVDSDHLEETYYLEAYDAENNLLWTVDDYFPPSSGGGGGSTEYFPLVNYINNGVFMDNIFDSFNLAGTTYLVLAPSNHKGFTPSQLNPVVTAYGIVGPDIIFTKNNSNATDQISFPIFPLASFPINVDGDVTPVHYCRYTCTVPAPESFKNFQFPITQKVKNLSNQVVTFKIWAAVTATPVTISVYSLQYFGSGANASAPLQYHAGDIPLTTTWTPYYVSFTIPDVSDFSLGTPGLQTDDDALFIQLGMPLDTACDVLFTKAALYLGNIEPPTEYETYDQISSVAYTFRTGDIKTSLNASAPRGWVPMNDGTIGNTGSGATLLAAPYTFQLYKTIWDAVSNTWAPISNPSGRGASAIADFLAGYTLKLPLSLGRALAGAGSGSGLPTYALGQNTGAVSTSVTLVAANLPPHTHTYNGQGSVNGFGFAQGTNTVVLNTGNGPGTSTPFSVATVPPSSFFNVFIKL